MNGIKTGAELPDRTPDRRSSKREPEGQDALLLSEEPEAEPAPAPGSDMRLLIEKDAAGAYYVYKLVDRATGEVIAERPRDQVAHLAEGPEYRAGAVVNTKA